MCTDQPINYTFIVIDDSESPRLPLLSEGPYFHKGPGVVYHCVNGLEVDRNYSVTVQVNSIAGSSKSEKYCFGKSQLYVCNNSFVID